MTTLPLGPVADDLRRLHRSLLVAVFVMVTIVGIGLVFGWDLVTRVQPAWPQIYPYTVAGIAALAIAIALFDAGRTAGIWVARVLAGGTLLAGASVDLAVARGLLPSTDAPTGGASAWFAALPSLATMSMAAAVLLLGSDRPAAARVRFGLALFTGLVSLLGLLSFLYGSASLFRGLGVTGTSLPTAVMGLAIVGSVLTARPDQPPLAMLDERYDRGLLRRVLPLLIAAPLLPAAITAIVGVWDPDRASAAAVSQLVLIAILVAVVSLIGAGQSRARRELSAERQRVWDAFEHTPAATAVVTTTGDIVMANAAMARLLGCPADELTGRQMTSFVIDGDRAAVVEGLAEVAAGGDGFRLDLRLTQLDGRTVWVDLGVASVSATAGRVTDLVVQCSDLTDRKHLERTLADQATRDPLTGLLNREGMARRLRDRGTRAADGQVLAVVFADVDGLKPLNDAFGHAAGDDLLREVARRLRAGTREDDIVARVGGDEFVVVTSLPEKGPDPAAAVVDRLRQQLRGPVAVGREITNLSVSLGASVLTEGDAATAVARADQAMYADKQRRRGSDLR